MLSELRVLYPIVLAAALIVWSVVHSHGGTATSSISPHISSAPTAASAQSDAPRLPDRPASAADQAQLPVGPASTPDVIGNDNYHKAVLEINDRVERKLETDIRNILIVGGIIGTIITFFGLGQFTKIRDDAISAAKAQIDDLVSEDSFANRVSDKLESKMIGAVEARIRDVSLEAVMAAAQVTAYKLESKDSFSDNERDTLIRQLNKARELRPNVIYDPQFLVVFEQGIAAFFSAGLWRQVSELHDTFPEVVLGSPDLQSWILDTYFRQAVGSAVRDLQIEERFFNLAKYVKVKSPLYGKLLVQYMCVTVNRKAPRWEQELSEFCKDRNSLPEPANVVFDKYLSSLLDPTKISRNPGSAEQRIASTAIVVDAKLKEIQVTG